MGNPSSNTGSENISHSDAVDTPILQAKLFWTDASSTTADLLNPLILYSAGAGETFTVNSWSNPLISFHLPINDTENDTERVREQMRTWCNGFKDYLRVSLDSSSKRKLRLRFASGNPFTFCLSLNRLRPNSSSYRIQDRCFLPLDRNRLPSSFNVIDATNLQDAGLVNVFVSALPLLSQSQGSILYTRTVSKSSVRECEAGLARLLYERTDIMSQLFGILSLPHQPPNKRDQLPKDQPLRHISWQCQPPDSIHSTELSRNLEQFLELLWEIYTNMLEDDKYPTGADIRSNARYYLPLYNINSFCALLSFLRERLALDWNMIIVHLRARFKLQADTSRFDMSVGFRLGLHLFGVDNIPRWVPIQSDHCNHCQLSRTHPLPEIKCVIVLIPPNMIQALLALLKTAKGKLPLPLVIKFASRGKLFTLPLTWHCFGELKSGADGRSCEIYQDPLGWNGHSNLYVYGYVPTYFLHKYACRLRDCYEVGVSWAPEAPIVWPIQETSEAYPIRGWAGWGLRDNETVVVDTLPKIHVPSSSRRNGSDPIIPTNLSAYAHIESSPEVTPRTAQVAADENNGLMSCGLESCKKTGTKICSRCMKTRYCSKTCQQEDWKSHKKACAASRK